MLDTLKDISTLTAGGLVVVLVMWKLFDYLAKIKGEGKDEYMTKDDHERECSYKMSYINSRLDNLEKKIDQIYRILLKINGDKI